CWDWIAIVPGCCADITTAIAKTEAILTFRPRSSATLYSGGRLVAPGRETACDTTFHMLLRCAAPILLLLAAFIPAWAASPLAARGYTVLPEPQQVSLS